MGGVGSGGPRIGAGRKPKADAAKALGGDAGHRRRKVVRHPSSPAAPVETPVVPVEAFDAPDDLTVDERNVWLRMAPYAFGNGTLTKATMYGFCLLCRNIVLERRYATSVADAGGANHRGLIQRIDAELLRFCLAPLGKPVVQPAKPEDPFAEFVGATG
jgi:hypothetical protein